MPISRCGLPRWSVRCASCAASSHRCALRRPTIRTPNHRRRTTDPRPRFSQNLRFRPTQSLRPRITLMADSLRDQLLKSGIVKHVQPERGQQDRVREQKRTPPPAQAGKPANKNAKAHPPSHASRPPRRDQGEMDLAKAYAIRAQTEASERKRIEQEAAEQARLRRERKLKIQQLLDGKALNKAEAD